MRLSFPPTANNFAFAKFNSQLDMYHKDSKVTDIAAIQKISFSFFSFSNLLLNS